MAEQDRACKAPLFRRSLMGTPNPDHDARQTLEHPGARSILQREFVRQFGFGLAAAMSGLEETEPAALEHVDDDVTASSRRPT